MNRIESRTRDDIPIIFDNYKLKKWLFRAGPRRQELLRKIYQIRNMDSKNKKGYRKATHDYDEALTLRGERRKLKHDLEKLNLSKSGLRRALLQLTTESYVVVDRLSKEIISSINDKDRAQGFARRAEEFIPFFLDNEYNQKDNRNKKDLNNSEDIRKGSKCSDELYDEELDADSTSQIISMSRCTKSRVNEIKIDGVKFKHKIKRRKESDKYKVKRCKHKCDHEEISKSRSIDKKVSTENNRNGIIPNNNDAGVIKAPIQINKQRLRRPILGASNELREKEFADDKGCCFSTLKTMEADSALSNDKINDTLKVHDNDIDINELMRTVRQCELPETVIIDKIQKNCNISDIFNRTYSSVDMRKRKKIRDKFHEIFDKCLTLSEEEEEEFIINACIRTRQRKKYKKLSNVDKNIEYPVVLDKATRQQDITSDLIVDTASRKTCEISNIELVGTLLNTRNVREFDEDQTVCDKDVFTTEIKLCGDDGVQKDNIIKFPLLCDNNDLIEMNLSNELPTKTCDVSVIDDVAEVIQPEEAHNEIVESTESIKVETNESSDFSIYNRNFNDTNVKVLTNNAIKIRTYRTNNSSSSSSNNNNDDDDDDDDDGDDDDDDNSNNNNGDDDDDKITCHASRNSCSKEVQLDRDSDGASIKTTITSAAVNSDAPVEKILEKSRDRENLTKTSKADTSFETPKKIDDAMIANINLTESSARNINDNNADIEVVIKPTYTETCENAQSNPKVYDKGNKINDDSLKSSKQDINEDLGQLLRMNINKNYRIESIGNTISIQENVVESSTNQNIIVKDICKNQLSSNNDSTNNNDEIEVVLEESTFGIIEENNDTSVIKRDNEKINDSSLNKIDFKEHSKLDDCPYNFIQSKGIKGNKIRVLSSAELGSRWCPTPVDTSLTEPINALVNETALSTNVNDTPSERTTDRKRSIKDAIILDDKYPSLSYTEYYLMSIHRRIMRIRALKKKFSSNDRRNVSAKFKELINNDMRFNSNFIVLLEELLNLGKELKIRDLKKVIRYAASVINKSFLTPEYKPISLQEIANYMTLFDKSISETFTFTSNASSKSNSSNASTFTFDNGFTSASSNDLSATIAPAISKQLSNNGNNVAQVVLTNVQNLHAPAAAEVQVIYNDLPKKNVYTSIGPNQKQECIVPHLQTSKKSNTSILCAAPPPVPPPPPPPPPPPTAAAAQSMHRNVQLLKESRQLFKTSMPCYGQQAIQQQFIPGVTFYNPANSNSMQSHNNKYITRRLNLNENVQYFIGNNAKYASQVAGQSNTVSHRIDNPRDMSKLSYARQASQQVNMSYNVPQRFPIQMAQDIKSSQISCSMTLSAQLPMVHFNNSENLLQRINKIPCELLVQIWDQVTFCLEESFFDCRAHEIYDKGTCVLKLFHVGWKEKIYKFIRYKSRQTSAESISNLKSKLAKYIYKTATMEAQKSICQVYLQKQKSQQLTDTMKILIQDMISKNHVNVESKCGSNTEVSRSSKSQKEELDNIKLGKQSDLRSLRNLTEDINKSDAISNILQGSLPVDNNNKFDNELVSINEMNRNEGDAVKPFTSLKNILSESGGILSNLRNKDIRVKEGNVTDNIDPRRLDSRESPISSEPPPPHIIDVRSISPTSFNTIKEVLPFPINDLQLSNINDDTKENGIEIKIQIPEDVICLNCSKISTVVCEICLEAHYCSKECAASHWIEKHHKYCKPHCVIGPIERKTCV